MVHRRLRRAGGRRDRLLGCDLLRRAHAGRRPKTGSCKTLAAFLWALDRLAARSTAATSADDAAENRRVLYISAACGGRGAQPAQPARRHRARGRAARAAAPAHPGGCALRCRPRRGPTAFARRPTDILITTPESLLLLLTSSAGEALRGVETVIMDEVHAIAHQARRPPRPFPRTAGHPDAAPGPTDRRVGDRPADRRGRPVPVRRAPP